jgi:hypothetical protein
MRLYAIPAYGRTYASEQACLEHWNLGVDFKIAGGPYFSKRDMIGLHAAGYRDIKISALDYNPANKMEVIIKL